MVAVPPGAPLTTCVRGLLALGPKPPLPAYRATIECVPGASVRVIEAWPSVSSAAVPRTTDPSANITAPIGAPAGEKTVADSVIASPVFAGFGDETRVVAVVAIAITTTS